MAGEILYHKGTGDRLIPGSSYVQDFYINIKPDYLYSYWDRDKWVFDMDVYKKRLLEDIRDMVYMFYSDGFIIDGKCVDLNSDTLHELSKIIYLTNRNKEDTFKFRLKNNTFGTFDVHKAILDYSLMEKELEDIRKDLWEIKDGINNSTSKEDLVKIKVRGFDMEKHLEKYLYKD